jgi:hypothetical protein
MAKCQWSDGPISMDESVPPFRVSFSTHEVEQFLARAREQVDDRKDHSAMTPSRRVGHARSSNRAPQDRAACAGKGPTRCRVTSKDICSYLVETVTLTK